MVLRNLMRCLRIYWDLFIDFLFGLYWERKRQPIPGLDQTHGMLAESATALAAKIRNKELKSEVLVNACIERIKIVNPFLNAVTDQRFEDALKDAREVDRKISEGLPKEYFKKRPFLGVPFTVKDCTEVEGMLLTIGMVSRRQIRGVRDAECVRLMKEAGAILVAVTNVPEGLIWQECRNMVYGQTNNPYHPGRTTGGSSGGEAALCAALASPISMCSDLGGSTRMPGFYCGLYAIHPTADLTNLRGITFRTGEIPSMCSISFVSKHVGDLAPLTKIVAGNKAGELGFDKPVNLKNLKVYYLEETQDPLVSPISTELKQTMKKAVEKLAELSSSATNKPRPYSHEGFNRMFALWKYWMTKEPEYFPRLLNNNQGEVNGVLELAKKVVGRSQHTLAAIMKVLDDQIMPVADATWAETVTDQLKQDLESKLGTDGVLLFPSASHVAPYHYSLLLRPYQSSHWAVLNALRVPVAQVPLGLNKDGLPLGLQIIGAPRQEGLCVAVAEYLGQQMGGFIPPCPIYQ